jgi:hypothetical protein
MPYKTLAKRKAYAKMWQLKNYKKNKARLMRLYRQNKEKFKNRSQKWRSKNHKQLLKTLRKYRRNNYAYVMLIAARARARNQNVPCTLVLSDISIPKKCPVLGIKLKPSSNGRWANSSPSLDRIKPRLGYTKNNVCVISWRANRLKHNGTLKEFEQIVRYMRGV